MIRKWANAFCLLTMLVPVGIDGSLFCRAYEHRLQAEKQMAETIAVAARLNGVDTPRGQAPSVIPVFWYCSLSETAAKVGLIFCAPALVLLIWDYWPKSTERS